jgi:hypothetical protein
MTVNRSAVFAFLAFGLVLSGRVSHAAIIGPYGIDANTRHLWHLEDAAVPIMDDPGVATPINLASLGTAAGGSLGGASFSPPSFGNDYNGVSTINTGIFANTPANGTADNTSMASFRNATTGAFTYEAMVKFAADPLTLPTGLQVISGDGETGGVDRAFQFVLATVIGSGAFHLEFENIAAGEGAGTGLISGNFAILQNTWYHVAIAYNGNENTANNLKFYWTEVNPANTGATEVGSVMMVNDMTCPNGDFAIGAEARNGGGGNTGQWSGMIDEVRVSDIARGPQDFIFVPEPSSVALAVFGLIGCGYRICRPKYEV